MIKYIFTIYCQSQISEKLICETNFLNSLVLKEILQRNNFIMKERKQRNPYIKRMGSQGAHKYTYDIDKGKYYLLGQEGEEIPIHKTGAIPAKFKANFTGFVNHKLRYEAAKKDRSALHFAPNFQFQKQNAYYTPITRKFIGYAQHPYARKDRKNGEYLKNPDQPHCFRRTKLKPATSQGTRKQRSENIILEHTAATFIEEGVNSDFFNKSFISMTESKGLPKSAKKSCYNYRCKYWQHFTFDPKSKTDSVTRISKSSCGERTTGKSFYEQQLRLEELEGKMQGTT